MRKKIDIKLTPSNDILTQLDSPISGMISEDGTFVFSGWCMILPKHQEYEIEIYSSCGKLIKNHIPNISRDDAFANLPYNSRSKSMPRDFFKGFYFSVRIEGPCEVKCKTKQTTTSLFSIFLLETIKNHEEQQSSEYHTLTPYSLKTSSYVDKNSVLDLTSFTRTISCLDFFSHLIESYIKFGKIEIPDPFNQDHKAILMTSMIAGCTNYPHFSNVLCFKTKDEIFYIGQFIHSANIVVFPDRNIIIDLEIFCFKPNDISSILQEINLNHLNIHKKALPDPFSSILINGWGPSHFFYDTYPSLYNFYRTKVGRDVKLSFLSVASHCYLPGTYFGASDDSIIELPLKDLNNIGQCNEINIIPGHSWRKSPIEEFYLMDQDIKQKSLTDKEVSWSSDIDGCYPIFWISISVNKRSLLNQVELITSLTEKLISIYPNMALIFDGMTANIFHSMKANEDAINEKKVVSNALMLLEEKKIHIKHLNLVGSESKQKIKECSKCNFFITSIASASIYPARFYKLPGIAHAPNCMDRLVLQEHFHTDTTIVPEEFVQDEELNIRGTDYTSYTISLDLFLDWSIKLISAKLPTNPSSS